MDKLDFDLEVHGAMRREITLQGASVSYSDTGRGDNAILFVHGNSLSSASFSPQFSDPILKDFRLIALDLPGHGRSGPANSPESMYTLDGYAGLLAEFVENLQTPKIVICGCSLGGHIAINSLEKLPNLAGLILSGTAPLRSMADFPAAFATTPMIQAFFESDLDEDKLTEMPRMLTNNADPVILEELTAEIRATAPQVRSILATSLGEKGINDETQALDDSGKTVAIVHGLKEAFLNTSYFQSLTIRNLWRNKFQAIDGAGHMPQLEKPSEFNALLRSYASGAFESVGSLQETTR